jgi:hypothetical protein
MRRALLTVSCAALLALGLAAPAQGAFDDPLFVFTPPVAGQPKVQPAGNFEGPCGLGVDSTARLYVSDYYHHAIDVFSSANPPAYVTQLANVDPTDGPCGLALDASNNLYVNNYHRNVAKFGPAFAFTPGPIFDSGDPGDIFANPTGVAVDPATNNVYVDDRAYIAAYGSSGAPLATPKIGAGTLTDGYGIAVSGFPATAGRIYVPDDGTDTVKVYNPAIDAVNPVGLISGPPGGFKSLDDSAIAIDNTTGEIYVIDTLGPQFTEKPQATVYVFTSTNTYKGRLKHNVIDGAPSGLAVDNSPTGAQGRVYVTSGITVGASIYAYPPGAATSASLPPIGASAPASPSAGGGGSVSAPTAPASTSLAGSSAPRATSSAISQQGNLRVTVSGKLHPRRLPRKGTAPISVAVGGLVSTTDGAPPPELKTITVEINRNGRFDTTGLPLCPIAKIQPASSSRALANCRSALVGEGSFTALAGFGEAETGVQETYATQGRLLLFNGTKGGKPVLFGQIYSARPFATSFVIPFSVKDISKGSFGTMLSATLPPALRSWGNLTGIEMKLSRRYAYQGKSHSYLSAGCPAPKGFGVAAFPLVRSTFAFEGGVSVTSTLTDQCKVRG